MSTALLMAMSKIQRRRPEPQPPMGIFGILAAGAFLLTFSKSSLKVASTRGTVKLTMDRGGVHPTTF